MHARNEPQEITSQNDTVRARGRAPACVNLESNLSSLVEAFSDATILDRGAF